MMVRKLTKVLNLKGCVIRLLDTKRWTLELVSSRGLSEKYVKKGSVDADRNIAEAMEGKTICIYNVMKDSRVQYQKEAYE